MAVDYKIRRAQVWILQVRKRGSSEVWSATSPRYFYSRAEVIGYIQREIHAGNFERYEYRPCRYVPAAMQ